MNDASTVTDPVEKANDRIRDAAKWLIASSAGVAAALIAGSQLSSIGKLTVGLPNSIESARLWVAVLGAIIGLVAIVYILWSAVQLLPEIHITIRDLSTEWENPSRRLRPAVNFLKERPKYLQGFKSPQDLETHREQAVNKLGNTDDDAKAADLKEYIADLDARITAIEKRAGNKALEGRFKSALKKLLAATAATTFGILAFAWAANPPSNSAPAKLSGAQLVNADLRDADLRNVKLNNADLSGANLRGANLTGADVTGSKWRDTVCPDGVNSDTAGHSCVGHLSK